MEYLGSQNTNDSVVDKEYVDTRLATKTTFWFGTRAEYNALPEIDPAVCYCIEEGT